MGLIINGTIPRVLSVSLLGVISFPFGFGVSGVLFPSNFPMERAERSTEKMYSGTVSRPLDCSVGSPSRSAGVLDKKNRRRVGGEFPVNGGERHGFTK